tara:strand:+ start:182 stop:580 length:399 start_codon:yes stop_codon:yes gene_type:complete
MPFKDKELQKAYQREWAKANREKCNEKNRIWYSQNKEKKKLQQQKYSQTEEGKKAFRMGKWRHRHVKNVNDELYNYYINCKACEVCNKEFTEANKRCLDHDHDTGEFRAVLCKGCNSFDNWKKVISHHTDTH